MKHRIVLAFSLLLMVGLSACVSMGGGGGSSLSARVDQHEQQIQSLMSQVGQVEQVLPGQAEMWSQMQTMRQEINILNGKIDNLSQGGSGGEGYGEVARLRDKVDRLESVVRQMAAQLGVNVDTLNVSDTGVYYPPAQPAAPAGGSGQPVAQTTGAVAPQASADKATALYNSGISSFDQRRYKDAAVSFKEFTASYPTHKLAGNAHFWEGESYYQMQDYARAALAYQEVIAKFPGSPKMQSAMLKQGMALHYANKKAAARERLQELVKRYPQSQEASRANKFLAANK